MGTNVAGRIGLGERIGTGVKEAHTSLGQVLVDLHNPLENLGIEGSFELARDEDFNDPLPEYPPL